MNLLLSSTQKVVILKDNILHNMYQLLELWNKTYSKGLQFMSSAIAGYS